MESSGNQKRARRERVLLWGGLAVAATLLLLAFASFESGPLAGKAYLAQRTSEVAEAIEGAFAVHSIGRVAVIDLLSYP